MHNMLDLLSATTTDMMPSVALALSIGAYAVRKKATSAIPYYQAGQAVDAIDAMASLRDGWAGEGSIAPSQRVIDAAKRAAVLVYGEAPFADIAPMPNGTIAFDWESEAGIANLEIGEDTFSFYLDLHESGDFYPVSAPVEALPPQLGCFISNGLLPQSSYARPALDTSYTQSWRGAGLAYA
ncbi:hypothetical protein IM687_00565 [Stutzerimonas stutzeri]|jgi:hypothetical protein|uniref:hypothetical protein n=1 Tax=Stutzerimonas stutzeri TaxID=316 RepID=UPI0018AAC6DD|nr:hypothetical protein [Stutzerimonas stutzeri]QPI09743.1 hypothetical protein IM687_00565 [Stutzerimonas stutzeri]